MRHRKEILAIAIPAIISNLTTPILGLVDVAITGHIGAAVYISAIAIGGTMFNMLYWIFNFLRMGSSGFTAQAYGASDTLRCRLILYRALLIGLAVGLAMIVLSRPLCDVVLDFMDADGATATLAARYFYICIWGAPAVMASYALAGWLIGMQDSKGAMWMAISTNVVNVAVSLTLVFGAGWKIEGVATGTMVAQWLGALTGGLIVWRRYKPALPSITLLLRRSELAAFFKVNIDIFLRTCCLVAVTVWFTHAGALQGADILAANAILLQLFMLFSFFMDGFAYAGEALAGKYAGARRPDMLKTLIKSLLTIGVMCAILFGLLYAVCGEWFIAMLAEDKGVVALAVQYLAWATIIPLCGFLAFIWDGIFVGLVATRAMLISMGVAILVFFITYFSLHTVWGNDALWLAFNAYLLARGLAEWAIYKLKG